jgi:WD40 repeat protein
MSTLLKSYAGDLVPSQKWPVEVGMEVCRSFESLKDVDHSRMVAIILHNLSTRSQVFHVPHAHKGKVSGLCFSPDQGRALLSCGVDRNVKLWALDQENQDTVSIFCFTIMSHRIFFLRMAATKCVSGKDRFQVCRFLPSSPTDST